MRTFAIGDIHGGLKALIQLIEGINPSKDDRLIFLGDYVDGWSESAQVVDYLIQLSDVCHCVFIKGNHDLWCEEWLREDAIPQVWYLNGGKESIESYSKIAKSRHSRHLEFFDETLLYFIDDENRLFVHAGFTSMHGVKQEFFKENFYFDRTLWEMARTMDNRIKMDSNLYPNRLKHYSEIYIGHTPTLHYDTLLPMNAINVWNIDTGAAFYGKISAIDIETKQVFQSDVVQTLYPNEKGRNR